MFAAKDMAKDSRIALYGGYRMKRGVNLPENLILPGIPYSHSIGLCEMAVDIPKGYTDITKYNGTMAHKINHNFDNSIKYSYVSEKCKTKGRDSITGFFYIAG